jgi:hypothetical protein
VVLCTYCFFTLHPTVYYTFVRRGEKLLYNTPIKSNLVAQLAWIDAGICVCIIRTPLVEADFAKGCMCGDVGCVRAAADRATTQLGYIPPLLVVVVAKRVLLYVI